MKETKFEKLKATLYLLATGVLFIAATEIVAVFYADKGESVPKWIYYSFMALGVSGLSFAFIKFKEAFSKHP